jgi:hypothetical protein
MGISQKIDDIGKYIQKKLNLSKPEITAISFEDRIEYDSDSSGHLIPAMNWKGNMTSEEIKAFPLINEPMASFTDSVVVHPFGVQPPVDYNVLWTYFKYTPEIVAVVRAIVEDIMSDGWELEGGRNNKLEAEKFLEKNHAKEEIISMLYDSMVTGDGYLYIQKIGKNEVKTAVDRIFSNIEIKNALGDKIKQELGSTFEADEDLFTPRSFISVASSTMKAQFDKNGDVANWIQRVGTKTQNYSPEEIMHFRLLRLDGKFYGYSPMVSILREMDILANVKDYARYFFEKGGVPNFMFILKNETPASNNFKQFKKSLQLYASLANKYKSMVVTGEVEAQALNKLTRDMEFRELAKYLTQVMIMVWGVPVTRLSDIGLGDRVSRGSTISTEGYYRKISHIQDLVEDYINMYLLSPFKVKMKFKPTYPQDQLRDAQIDKIKTDTVEQRIRLGLWTREDGGLYCGIAKENLPTEEEFRANQMMSPPKQGWGTGQQGTDKMSNFQLLSDSTEKMGQASDKQAVALDKKSVNKSYIIEALDKDKSYIIETLEDNKIKVTEDRT